MNLPPRIGGLRLIRVVLVAACFGTALNSGAALLLFKANADRVEQVQTAQAALCAFRADLVRRVASSEQFLREHPKGIPGIPASTIRNGIVNQRRTVVALRGLHCSD